MSKHSRPNVFLRVVLAVVSVLVITALVSAAVVYRPSWLHADNPPVRHSSVGSTVSPRQLQTYCPSRMSIADTDAYGDSEYQASNGNIASSARYAAFGSVFHSSVAALGSDSATPALTLSKKNAESADGAFVGSGNVDDGSQLQDTRLLTASDGTGVASAVMSWATDGDLKGVSASSCIVPALEQTFLVAGTQTGMTQQLIVANPSAKATSVNVKVWVSAKAGMLALSTGSTLTVGAGKESVLNLAAAASGQDALYVTVSGSDTPVAAVVRTVSMDGLTPKGADYTVPNNVSARSLALYGVEHDDRAMVYIYAAHKTDVTISWVNTKGAVQANQQTLDANRASVIDLGDVPRSADGIYISADKPVSAAAKISDSGAGGQADFALVNASVPMKVSAIAIPDQSAATAVVGVINITDEEQTATLTAFDADGGQVDQRDLAIPPLASTTVSIDDLDNGNISAIRLKDSSKSMVWDLRVGQQDVSDAKLAGLSVIGAADLKESRERIWANQDMTIVR